MTEQKRTPLFPLYEKYGARVVDFAGWDLPVQFAGIAEEHRAVRAQAGLFDVSHMGEIRITGPGALEYLQYVLVNDFANHGPGRAIYSPLCYPDGGCVDDLLVYIQGPGDYLLVVNAANTEKDLAWLLANRSGFDTCITDESALHAQLALQGPASAAILARLTEDKEALNLKYYRFKSAVRLAGLDCLVSRTGYTGEDGFEFYLSPANSPALWEALLAEGVVPVGLGARDTLRLEAGMPLYGHELSPGITPIEAGLDRFVAFAKPRFIGREPLRRQAENGPPRRLVGLELDRGVPRAEYTIHAEDGEGVGLVTSGTVSPLTGRPIALALLSAAAAATAIPLSVRIREKDYPARRVEMPFYRRRREV